MKPLISYYGGKQRIASRIVSVLEGIPHTVYCEPFFGGGAVFYARSLVAPSSIDEYREIINDKSELLINLYRVARSDPDWFHYEMLMTPYSRCEYKRSVHICRNPEQYDPKERAWAYYLNIQQSFAKKLNGGWGTAVVSQHSAAIWNNKRYRIPQCLARLKDVHIECDDALAVIERWASPQTLFYLDPPYPSTEMGHYSGYSTEDFQSLCDLLDSIQGSYVLSNYDSGISPGSAQRRIEIKAIASSDGKGKTGKGRDKSKESEGLGDRDRTEVLWICDRSNDTRDELRNDVKTAQLALFQ